MAVIDYSKHNPKEIDKFILSVSFGKCKIVFRKEWYDMARIKWREEFDKVDEENMRLLCECRKEQLRKIIMQIALDCDNEKYLDSIAAFAATMNDKSIRRVMGGYELAPKGKVGVA